MALRQAAMASSSFFWASRAKPSLTYTLAYTLADGEPTCTISHIEHVSHLRHHSDSHTRNHGNECPNARATEGNRPATQGNSRSVYLRTSQRRPGCCCGPHTGRSGSPVGGRTYPTE